MNHHDRRGRRAVRPATLLDAGAALMRAEDEASLLRVLVHTARDLSGAVFVAVLVRTLPQEHEEGGQPTSAGNARVHLAVAVGLSQEQEATLRHILLNRQELLAPLWQGGELVRVPGPIALAPPPAEPATSAGKGPSAQTAQEQPLVPALLAVPLLASDGQVQSGLLMGLHGLDQVRRQDEAVLVSFTGMAALALEKGRCIWQAQEQAELIEHALDAILMRDADDRVVSWNRGAEQLYGWSAQEALGLMTNELLKTHFPVQRAFVDAHLEREGQWEGELWQSRRDGRRILVESRQALVRDADGQPSAILEIDRDITLRSQLEAFARRMQTTTEARRALLQLVLDELPSSVYLVRSHDARLVLANHATTALWGASWELHQPLSEFLQQNGIRINGPDGRELAPEHWATLRALQHGEAVSQQQETIRHTDGTSLPVLVNAVPLDISLMFPALEEITLGETQATEPAALVVNQDVSALKEAERLKDEFITIAAHELRTPLAILKGYTETLLLGQQGRGLEEAVQWQKEVLDNIDLATRQLVELTEALLDVTRLQAGRLELHPEPSDLVALVRRVIKRMQRTTQQHSLSLRSSQEYLVVPLDPGRMEQVLTNLLGNAIKYSPRGGPIEVAAWAEPLSAEVVLSVRDEGVGIPAQQQASVFERFFRADNARILPGIGLGLYICRSLVELHGGRLWFTSVEGRGTTFFLALPTEGEVATPS